MKKIFCLCMCTFILLNLCRGVERFDRGIVKRTFVPKGQWFIGGTCSYSEYTQDNYKLLVLESWNGEGYQLAIKPFGGYMIRDDFGLGATFAYERTLFKIDNLDITISDDFEFNISDYYILEHLYTGSVFMRLFMNIEQSRRFGLFNDVKLMAGGGQGKYVSGKGDELTGTHQNIFKAGLLYSPGLCVFINDYAAVEASIGVLGLQMKNVRQTTNQVYTGSFRKSSANFKVDLFSISLGFAIYL